MNNNHLNLTKISPKIEKGSLAVEKSRNKTMNNNKTAQLFNKKAAIMKTTAVAIFALRINSVPKWCLDNRFLIDS